jgi:hypothetical protein
LHNDQLADNGKDYQRLKDYQWLFDLNPDDLPTDRQYFMRVGGGMVTVPGYDRDKYLACLKREVLEPDHIRWDNGTLLRDLKDLERIVNGDRTGIAVPNFDHIRERPPASTLEAEHRSS